MKDKSDMQQCRLIRVSGVGKGLFFERVDVQKTEATKFY